MGDCAVGACSERAVSLVVGRGLTSTKTSTAAATALLDLCHACTGRLADQFDSLTSQCLVALKLPHRDAQVALNVLKGATPPPPPRALFVLLTLFSDCCSFCLLIGSSQSVFITLNIHSDPKKVTQLLFTINLKIAKKI